MFFWFVRPVKNDNGQMILGTHEIANDRRAPADLLNPFFGCWSGEEIL